MKVRFQNVFHIRLESRDKVLIKNFGEYLVKENISPFHSLCMTPNTYDGFFEMKHHRNITEWLLRNEP